MIKQKERKKCSMQKDKHGNSKNGIEREKEREGKARWLKVCNDKNAVEIVLVNTILW